MANFKPFNEYTFFLLGKILDEYQIKSPFLDVGCGKGYLSKYLHSKKMSGVAIDYSDKLIEFSKDVLKNTGIVVRKKNIFDVNSKYNSIFFWDVIEHVKEDSKCLKHCAKIINKRGYIIISVPANPDEWGWDDEYYGHYRRYTPQTWNEKLKKSGFTTRLVWDTTFPIFWFMRRVYLKIKRPISQNKTRFEKTKKSANASPWSFPLSDIIIKNLEFIWKLIYQIQYTLFKDFTDKGFSILIVAQKD